MESLPDDVGAGRRGVLALLVSELVTNSIRYGNGAPGARIAVEVQLRGDRLRVEVADAGTGFEPPATPAPGEPRPSGWGLYLVERLADRWGVSRDPHTRVWFELG